MKPRTKPKVPPDHEPNPMVIDLGGLVFGPGPSHRCAVCGHDFLAMDFPPDNDGTKGPETDDGHGRWEIPFFKDLPNGEVWYLILCSYPCAMGRMQKPACN